MLVARKASFSEVEPSPFTSNLKTSALIFQNDHVGVPAFFATHAQWGEGGQKCTVNSLGNEASLA